MSKTDERCTWCGDDPIYMAYHDEEWGVPCFDDQKLFEFLILEGAQAGLSWITILKRRAGYQRAFKEFDVEKVARFSAKKMEALRLDTGIIRNRLKIESAVTNARCFIEVVEEKGSFANFIWQFVGGQPIQNRWKSMSNVPATTPESDAMSKALKKRGFKFVGSTICYAYMQAMGLVNDHTIDCFRHKECRSMSV